MLLWRVKPLGRIIATAERKARGRRLGALARPGIGAIIGAAIFVFTAVAADNAGPA